jgi:hypothetical protein
MSERRREHFSTRDAMILIALIAVGLAGSMAYRDYDTFGHFIGPGHPFPGDLVGCSLTVFLLIVAMGLLLVRILRRPRPRRFALGAGTAGNIASLLSLLFIAISWANIIINQLYAEGETQTRLVYHVVANVPYDAGPSVMTAWAILALARRWRAKDWIERIGVSLGVLWILLYIYQGLLSRWVLTLTSR